MSVFLKSSIFCTLSSTSPLLKCAHVWQPVTCVTARLIATASYPLLMKVTPALNAEPLKKKTLSSNINPDRLRKRKKRLENSIERADRMASRLKPILDIEGYSEIRINLSERQRGRKKKRSFDEIYAREQAEEEFSKLMEKHESVETAERKALAQALSEQTLALAALKEENLELYQMAVQIDPTLIPFERKGPSYTPPNPDYKVPLGEFNDKTDQFDRTYARIDIQEAVQKSMKK